MDTIGMETVNNIRGIKNSLLRNFIIYVINYVGALEKTHNYSITIMTGDEIATIILERNGVVTVFNLANIISPNIRVQEVGILARDVGDEILDVLRNH